MFDIVEITSVGRGEKIIMDMFKNDANVPELGDWYGILKFEGQPHVIVVDASDPEHPRFLMRCKEELVGISFPDKAIQEDLDVWLGRTKEGQKDRKD